MRTKLTDYASAHYRVCFLRVTKCIVIEEVYFTIVEEISTCAAGGLAGGSSRHLTEGYVRRSSDINTGGIVARLVVGGRR